MAHEDSADARFDPLLLSIAQQCQGIDQLLEVFLSFLRRKTDFYTGASADKVEETVKRAVEKQLALAEHTRQEQRRQREAEEKKRQQRLARQKKEQDEAAAKAAKAAQQAASASAAASSSNVVELGADGSFDVSEAAAAFPSVGNSENALKKGQGEDNEEEAEGKGRK